MNMTGELGKSAIDVASLSKEDSHVDNASISRSELANTIKLRTEK